MITPKDIENPARKSGYDHVGFRKQGRRDGLGYKPYQARHGSNWSGEQKCLSRRKTALEAAQDYCDYINGNDVQHTVTLKPAGHEYTVERDEKNEEVQAALAVLRDWKAQKEGKQGYVYLIQEKNSRYGKIGYSVNPEKRIAEVQTGNPRELELIGYVEGTEETERALHAKYIDQNVLQEWFKVTTEMRKEFV